MMVKECVNRGKYVSLCPGKGRSIIMYVYALIVSRAFQR